MSDPKNPEPGAPEAPTLTTAEKKALADAKKKAEAEAKKAADVTPGAAIDTDVVAQMQKTMEAQGKLLASLTEQLQAQSVRQSGAAVSSIGDGPANKGESEIEAFLAADPAKYKGHYFSRFARRYMIILVHDKKVFNQATQETDTTPCIEARARNWTGPGSELRSADNRKIIKWGWINLADLPEVQNQTVSLDLLCARIEATADYASGALLDFAHAREYLRVEYDRLALDARSRAALEGRLNSLPPGAEKSGILAV